MAQKITRDSGYVGQRKRDGKWFARLTWTDETTGKRIDRTKFGRDKAHAERLLSALIAESNGEALESPLIEVELTSELASLRSAQASASAQPNAATVTPAFLSNRGGSSGVMASRVGLYRSKRIGVTESFCSPTPFHFSRHST
jgi:hypothetical protein